MITRSLEDHVTLSGVRDDGTPFSVSPRDSGYFSVLTTLNLQNQAEITNTNNASIYLGQLKNYQDLIDAGRVGTTPAPSIPNRTCVSDLGVVSFKPYDPPLPLPKFPTITPGVPFSSTTTVGTTDSQKLDILISLITELLKKS